MIEKKESKRRVGDWVDGFLFYTNNSEPPITYRKWVAISVIAAALQRKCMLRWGPIEVYPNMYIVLVGPSGECAKGTAMTPGYNLLRKLGIKLVPEAITREALCRDLARSTDSRVAPGSVIPILHSSLTIYSQELTVFLGYNNQQLMSDLCDWYDCRPLWTYRTKHEGEDSITGVWVNLIGATTPELIQTALPYDAIGSGLASRIIFVTEYRRGKAVPLPFLTEEEVKIGEDLLIDLECINMLAGEYKVTKQFLDMWVIWYEDHIKNPPFRNPKFGGYLSRRRTHILKLCCILNASRTDSMVIEVCDLERSILFLTEIEKNMQSTFAGVGRSDNAGVMNQLMAEIANAGSISFRKLLEIFHQDVDDKEHLMKMILTIEVMGKCKLEQKALERDIIIHYTGIGREL